MVLPEQTVEFTCSVLSNDTVNVEWKKKNGLLPTDSLEISQFNEEKNEMTSSLKITKVKLSNEGQYCCVATNKCGSKEGCAWLQING